VRPPFETAVPEAVDDAAGAQRGHVEAAAVVGDHDGAGVEAVEDGTEQGGFVPGVGEEHLVHLKHGAALHADADQEGDHAAAAQAQALDVEHGDVAGRGGRRRGRVDQAEQVGRGAERRGTGGAEQRRQVDVDAPDPGGAVGGVLGFEARLARQRWGGAGPCNRVASALRRRARRSRTAETAQPGQLLAQCRDGRRAARLRRGCRVIVNTGCN